MNYVSLDLMLFDVGGLILKLIESLVQFCALKEVCLLLSFISISSGTSGVLKMIS